MTRRTWMVSTLLALSGVALAACSPAATPTPTPAPTATPVPAATPTPRPAPDRSTTPFRLDLDDGVVAAFEWYGADERAAFMTHVPTGAQVKVDESGNVLERHAGRGDGEAVLSAMLADPDAMRAVLEGLDGIGERVASMGGGVDWIDFIQFGGTRYMGEPRYRAAAERAATEADLGEEVYRVAFELSEHAESEYQARDGDAAFLAVGTPIYAVNGYRPQFRLAAMRDGKVVVFEADTVPGAKTGADLLDIDGKVWAVVFYDRYNVASELARVDAPEAVADIVRMVLAAPVDRTKRDTDGVSYPVSFLLEDGTAVTRWYWLTTGLLQGGIQLPEAFRQYAPGEPCHDRPDPDCAR